MPRKKLVTVGAANRARIHSTRLQVTTMGPTRKSRRPPGQMGGQILPATTPKMLLGSFHIRTFSLLIALNFSAVIVDAFGFTLSHFSRTADSSPVSCSSLLKSPLQNFRKMGLRTSRNNPTSMKVVEGGLGLKYTTDDGINIAYDFLPGRSPTVFYLPSLNQTRHGSKAAALQTWCKRNKQAVEYL